MINLLSAGCSFVYGAELSDSPDPLGNNKPSNKSWVSLYANKKGYNHITEATCGISNVGIARKVISAVENEVVDKVIVQWTFIDRFELRWNNDNYQTFAWWNSKDYSTDNKFVNEFRGKNKANTEIATLWYKNIHSKNTAYYYYIKSKVELGNYLNFKKIPYVFLDAENIEIPKTDDIYINSYTNISKNFNNLSFDGMGFYDWATNNNFPVGNEGHPLDEAHRAAFELIQQDLDEKLNIF